MPFSDPEKRKEYARAYYHSHADANRNARRRYRVANLDRERARSNAYYAANRERICTKSETNRLQRQYGLTREQYRDMVVGQAGRCLICLRVPPDDLHIDHDHVTGKVRGLLCGPCNRGIGLLAEDSQRIARAARYLT